MQIYRRRAWSREAQDNMDDIKDRDLREWKLYEFDPKVQTFN